MLLGICVFKLFRAFLALEHCSFQCFHDYIVAASLNKGFFAMWAASLLTYLDLDALTAVKSVAFTALDHVFNYVRTKSAGKFCNQLLIKGLVW